MNIYLISSQILENWTTTDFTVALPPRSKRALMRLIQKALLKAFDQGRKEAKKGEKK